MKKIFGKMVVLSFALALSIIASPAMASKGDQGGMTTLGGPYIPWGVSGITTLGGPYIPWGASGITTLGGPYIPWDGPR
jgi:hypothetical protein